MELELTGHQAAKDRSTHSFHVSGIYTSTTQESKKGLWGPPGWLPCWGHTRRRLNHRVTESPATPQAVPTCGCLEGTQVDVRGAFRHIGQSLR